MAKKLVTPINLAVATLEIINLWGPRQRNFSAPGGRKGGGGGPPEPPKLLPQSGGGGREGKGGEVVPLAGNRYRIQVQFASSKL